MSVTFDAKSNGFTGTGSSGSELIISHTVGTGSNRLLVVGVTIRDKDVTVNYVKWGGTGGTALTPLTAYVDATNEVFAQMFYLINPDSGTKDVAIQISVNDSVEGICVSFDGAAQSDVVDDDQGASGNAASNTESMTFSRGGVAVDTCISDEKDAMTDGGAATESLYNTDRGNYQVGGQYRIESGSGNYDMAWTFDSADLFAHAVAVFKEAVSSSSSSSSFSSSSSSSSLSSSSSSFSSSSSSFSSSSLSSFSSSSSSFSSSSSSFSSSSFSSSSSSFSSSSSSFSSSSFSSSSSSFSSSSNSFSSSSSSSPDSFSSSSSSHSSSSYSSSSYSSCSSSSTSLYTAPLDLTWGKESPATGTGLKWTNLKDDDSATPSITGDDYGSLRLNVDDVGQTEVIGVDDTSVKNITLTRNDSIGYFWPFIRGSTTPFLSNNVSKLWEYYDGTISENWKYIQARLVGKMKTLVGVRAELDFIVYCSWTDQNPKYSDWAGWWAGADIQGALNSNRISDIANDWVEPGTTAMAMIGFMQGIEYLKDNDIDTTIYENVADDYFDTWLRTNNQAQKTAGNDSGGYVTQVYYDNSGNVSSVDDPSGAVTGQIMSAMWAYRQYLVNIGETTKATNWVNNAWTIFSNAAAYLVNLFDNYNGTDINMMPANTTTNDCWIHAAAHGKVALENAVSWGTLKSAGTSDYSRIAAALGTGMATYKDTGTTKNYYKVRVWNVDHYNANSYDTCFDQLCFAPHQFGAVSIDSFAEDISDWWTNGDGTYNMTWQINDISNWRFYGTRWHWYFIANDDTDKLYPGPGFQLAIMEARIYNSASDNDYRTRALNRLIWGTSKDYANLWWKRNRLKESEFSNGFQDWRDGDEPATLAETWARFCDTSSYYIQLLLLLEGETFNY